MKSDQNRKPQWTRIAPRRDLTVDVSDLVAHGEADELIRGAVHDEDLVDAELLGGGRGSGGLVVLAAAEGDGVAPLVGPGLSGAVRMTHNVVSGGGRRDHWWDR